VGSDVLPGNVHDLAAARENVLGVLRPFLDAMPVLADPGYEGAGHGVHSGGARLIAPHITFIQPQEDPRRPRILLARRVR
jgi:hypothetical protein